MTLNLEAESNLAALAKQNDWDSYNCEGDDDGNGDDIIHGGGNNKDEDNKSTLSALAKQVDGGGNNKGEDNNSTLSALAKQVATSPGLRPTSLPSSE